MDSNKLGAEYKEYRGDKAVVLINGLSKYSIDFMESQVIRLGYKYVKFYKSNNVIVIAATTYEDKTFILEVSDCNPPGVICFTSISYEIWKMLSF